MERRRQVWGTGAGRRDFTGMPLTEGNHDVLIIGSGASGGMAAYTLARKGVKCLMLDAGPGRRFRPRS